MPGASGPSRLRRALACLLLAAPLAAPADPVIRELDFQKECAAVLGGARPGHVAFHDMAYCRDKANRRSVSFDELCVRRFGPYASLYTTSSFPAGCLWDTQRSFTLGSASADRRRILGYLGSCARRSRGRADWVWTDVHYREGCANGKGYRNRARFWTYQDRGQLVLRLPLRLRFPAGQEELLKARFQRDLSCVRKFWRDSYSVRFEVVPSNEPEDLLNLYVSVDPIDSSNVALEEGSFGAAWDTVGCRTLLHELGHRVGMEDRYPAPFECDGRKVARTFDIMRGYASPWHRLEYSLPDLQNTFGNYCGDLFPSP
jgi:hypothetical protein